MTTQRRARAALAARMRELVPRDALHPGGEHALRFADALVPTLSDDDVRWAHAHLQRGAKGELRASRAGTISAHGAWSSTALVCSAFAPWRYRLAGLRLEERLHVPHGGGTPNLDVAFDAGVRLVGIESKLTEHLAATAPRAWRPAYRRPAMRAALEGGWAEVFADLLEGRWTPRFLDAAQLVKHALSLQRREADLVLVFWEPVNGDDIADVRAHREEVAELRARLGARAAPRLHAFAFGEVLDAWQTELPEHVAALRERYAVAI